MTALLKWIYSMLECRQALEGAQMPLVSMPDLTLVAADSPHVAWDVTKYTDTHKPDMLAYRHLYEHTHTNIVTSEMSAGAVVCDVISLSCHVSVLAYS